MLPFQNILKITLQQKYADIKKIDQENLMYSQNVFSLAFPTWIWHLFSYVIAKLWNIN